MSTLAEILKNRQLPVKVRYSAWSDKMFLDVHRVNNKYAIGFTQNDCPDYYELASKGWELYEEPNQPIVRWLWANTDGEIPYKLFSEDEIKNSQYSKNGYNIKLEFSRTEFTG